VAAAAVVAAMVAAVAVASGRASCGGWLFLRSTRCLAWALHGQCGHAVVSAATITMKHYLDLRWRSKIAESWAHCGDSDGSFVATGD
jgi:hypothetical protein